MWYKSIDWKSKKQTNKKTQDIFVKYFQCYVLYSYLFLRFYARQTLLFILLTLVIQDTCFTGGIKSDP